MSKSLSSVLVIIVLVIAFAIGTVFGMFVQVQKDGPQIDQASETLRMLTSNAIPSVVVYGQITGINGRTVTVSFNGDTAVVTLRDNAAISSFSGQAGTIPQATDLSQVQQGQTASISAKVLADGSLQGESLIILPGR